ncbi:MAG: short-chain dehydrogenase [Deltaproteobacteria bacterium HGW-Deltaproteobacteria-14]|nr:MAG: short-chain dehydrogenase [Deltaproteobacteria bacterium HGW-Deltaproteobacteria-14]
MGVGFSESDIGEQRGRVVVVTGANSGIGFETARVLAERGATVVMACRNPDKGEAAAAQIRALAPAEGEVALLPLDLADLASVAGFARAVRERFDRLDLLINNAGVMMPKRRGETADGFELQLGTNHLGHFALTGALLELVRRTPGARVVTVSSLAHRMGHIDFEDLQWTRSYKRMPAYGQSKLANLLFARELGRRLAAAGADTISVAAHPGYTATNLQNTVTAFKLFNPVVGQSAARGALPTLFAAVSPGLQSGDYFGPGGPFELRGRPRPAKVSQRAQDEAVAARLWAVSEELTGVRYELAASSPPATTTG